MRLLLLCFLSLAASVFAAERRLEFGEVPTGKTPPGFRSALNGQGPPGEWKIVMDEVPPLLAPLTPGAGVVTSRPVLAQLSRDPTDERFPLLILEEQTFRDFTVTTRFKMVEGKVERMAGIAFRIQDETNYYVLRASSLGNTFRFYKVVNGQRGQLYGPNVPIPSGTWHEMSIQCEGTQIKCFLNGQQVIPTLTDSSFASGRIGFWTKSDSVSYFADALIRYVPTEPPAQALVRDMLQAYNRLRGLRIYVRGDAPETTKVIASGNPEEIGQPGGAAELDVIQQGNFYYAKGKKSVGVTMPLRDRNGEIVAATRLDLTTFPGQTEKTAVERAGPVVRAMQGRVQSMQDLVE